jgi:hypothetical protein
LVAHLTKGGLRFESVRYHNSVLQMDIPLETTTPNAIVYLHDAIAEDVVMSDAPDATTSVEFHQAFVETENSIDLNKPIEISSENYDDTKIDDFIAQLRKYKHLSLQQLNYLCERVCFLRDWNYVFIFLCLNLMMNITNCNVITFSFRLKKCWSKKQPL